MPTGIYKRRSRTVIASSGKVTSITDKPKKKRGRPRKNASAHSGQLAEVIPPKLSGKKHLFAHMFDPPKSPQPCGMFIVDDPIDLVNWIAGWFKLHPDGRISLREGEINIKVE